MVVDQKEDPHPSSLIQCYLKAATSEMDPWVKAIWWRVGGVDMWFGKGFFNTKIEAKAKTNSNTNKIEAYSCMYYSTTAVSNDIIQEFGMGSLKFREL